jgi:hypothetical protein
MSDKGASRVEAFIVCAVVVTVAALLSGWLTFSVQFERQKEMKVEKPKSMSLAAWQMKELERKQEHEHFHLGVEDKALDAWAEKSSCIICHTVYPHGRNKQAMAIINLHTEFMTCNTCHLKLSEKTGLRFGWVNPPGMNPTDKPYGTSIDAKTGYLAPSSNHVSKITPLHLVEGALHPYMSEQDIASSMKYMAGKDSYTEEQKKQIVDSMHKDTEIKEFVMCKQCHSSTGIMPFAQLGFDQTRANQLQQMEIGGMLTNYEIFYFPDLFKQK